MIPDYQSMMLPVLQACADGEISNHDALIKLGDHFELPPEERYKKYPNGQKSVFLDRMTWAKSYLKHAGLLTYPRRGFFSITDAGLQLLAKKPALLNNEMLMAYPEFVDFYQRNRQHREQENSQDEAAQTPSSDFTRPLTPHDQLEDAFSQIQSSLEQELLDRVRAMDPKAFEDLIVTLFMAMGYGGAREDAGRSIGRTGDNGVDGVIDQDPLGVDQIYIQAKRYAEGNNIGAGAIRDFFGALSLKKAHKGIFVTTSDFTAEATLTAKGLDKRLVLIAGAQLSHLMVQHNVGCRIKNTLHLKDIDEDFF